jgi:hypothetical protein
MKIRISRLVLYFKHIDFADLKRICAKHLKLDFQGLQTKITAESVVFTHVTAEKQKPAVTITASNSIFMSDCDVQVVLTQSFFRMYPDFEVSGFVDDIRRFRHCVHQLDIAYIDTERCLSVRDIRYWCEHSRDYCVGTLVKWDTPKISLENGQVSSIRLGTNRSKTNYGVITVTPRSGVIKFTLKVRHIDKIQYLLKGTGERPTCEGFEARSRALLVSSFDVVTARSKKSRVKSRYDRQKLWKLFLQYDANYINWSNVIRQKKGVA